MWLILILTIGQAVSSTLAWIGFYAGVHLAWGESAPGALDYRLGSGRRGLARRRVPARRC